MSVQNLCSPKDTANRWDPVDDTRYKDITKSVETYHLVLNMNGDKEIDRVCNRTASRTQSFHFSIEHPSAPRFLARTRYLRPEFDQKRQQDRLKHEMRD